MKHPSDTFNHPRLRPLGTNFRVDAPHVPPDTVIDLSPASLSRMRFLEKRERSLCRYNVALARVVDLPPATFTSGIEEKKFYVPTGRFRTGKRTGKATEEKIPMLLQTATVTVTDGIRVFSFTATNRGPRVLDSRDKMRKPISEIRAELARLLGDDRADTAATDLLLVLPDATAPRKPRPPKVFERDDTFQSDRTTEQDITGTAAIKAAELLDEIWTLEAGRMSAVERFEARIAAV